MTQYTAFLLLAPLSAASSLGVLIYALRHGVSSKRRVLLWLLVSVIGWLTFNSLELASSTPSMTLFWAKVSYPFITATPVAWLIFTLYYTDLAFELEWSKLWLGLLIPFVTVLLVWTNEFHGLMWQSYEFISTGRWLSLHVSHGSWFYIHAVYCYALVFLGALLIFHHHLRMQRIYRHQSRWLVAGGIIPSLFNVIYVFDLVPGLTKDYTSIGFAVSGLAFAMGIFRHRLFDLRPIARAALVDNMKDATVTTDGLDRVVDLNPAAVQLLRRLDGGLSESRLIGRPVTNVLRRLPGLVQCLDRTELVEMDIELQVQETTHYYECRLVPLRRVRDRYAGRLIMLHDITSRKETEARLRHQRAELEVRNEQLDAFARTVAHDLKGPLNTVIGYGQMIDRYLERLSPEEVHEHLGSLVETGQRMSQIIDSLLLLSRVQLDEVVVDVLDMEPIVEEALDRVLSMPSVPPQVGITTPDVWPWILGHGPWIVEIWANLINNAIKYGSTPPKMELGFEAISKPHFKGNGDQTAVRQEIRFWVRDEGPGLTEEQQQQVFQPFVRFHPTRAEGTGLGLAIVQQIVHKLSGRVGVASRPGEGCTFWFTLPVADTAMAERPVKVSAGEVN